MRKLIILLVVLAFAAVPAFAAINWDNGITGCTMNVSITIAEWAQVQCQDNSIIFSGNTTTGYNDGDGDWWGTSKDGYYAAISSAVPPDGKASTDPWAGAEYITGDPDGSPTGIYYEATNNARHYVRTNTDIRGTVVCNTLTNQHPNGGTMPTYFTIAMAGDGTNPAYNNGSALNVVSDFPGPPTNNAGAYGADAGSNTIAYTGGSPHGFAAGTWTYDLLCPAFGTISFHARILRQGMMNCAGNYTATITVTYSDLSP